MLLDLCYYQKSITYSSSPVQNETDQIDQMEQAKKEKLG